MTRPLSARARLCASLAGLAALLLLIAIVVLALFVARRTIAEHLALDWLRRRGVAAAVSVRSLGLTGMEAQVRFGPKASPTLTAESVEMGYRITGPWEGRPLGLEPSRLVFTGPALSARYDGRRLDVGALQPILDDILAHPAAPGAAQPSIAIRRGRLALSTPYGPLTLSGDAAVSAGELDRLDAAVGPLDLSGPRLRVVAPGGARLGVTRQGRVSTVSLRAPFRVLRVGGVSAGPGVMTLWARAPAPDTTGLHGTTQVVADMTATSASAVGLGGGGVSAHATLNGDLAVDERGQAFDGAAGLRGQVDDLATTALRARKVSAAVRLASVRFDRRDSGTTWQARFSADGSAGAITGPGAAASRLSVAAQGHVGDGGAQLDGRLSARGGATAKASRRVIAALGLDRWAGGYAQAMAAASRDVAISAPAWRVSVEPEGWRAALMAPMTATARSGARLTLSGRPGTTFAGGGAVAAKGGFDVALAGGGLPDLKVQVSGWTAARGRLAADLAAQASADLDLAKGVRADIHGHAMVSPGAASFALTGCAPLSAAEVGTGDTRLTRLAMRLCADGGPLAVADQGGWRLAGRIDGGAGESPTMAARLAGVAASFAAHGGARQAPTANLRVTGARLSDLSGETRFAPLAATGEAALDGDAVQGHFALATPRGQTLGQGTFAHDLRDGTGRARFAAHALAFAAKGLQPRDIAPSLRMMSRAHGHVTFDGDLAWSSRGVTSWGRLGTRDLGFTSPVGDIVDAAGQIALSNLAPLTTAPGQTITARRVDGVVSITDVKIGFDASPTALDVKSATAQVASGQASVEPFHVDLGPQATWRSSLVLHHVDIGRLIAASSLASSMTLQAVVDGRLPFEAGPAGLRFTQGRIEAVGPGRLTIARGALAGAGPATGGGVAVNNAAQDFAYQALEDLAFDSLDAGIDSVAGDRLRVLFHIKGRHDPPAKTTARVGLLALLRGKAFDKPLPLPSDTGINLTLDTSLNFGELIHSLDAIWKGGAADRSPPVQGTGPQKESP